MTSDTEAGIMGLITVLIILGFFAMQPYFEARAFNKFTTGPKATYWDAMWTSLRVQTQK